MDRNTVSSGDGAVPMRERAVPLDVVAVLLFVGVTDAVVLGVVPEVPVIGELMALLFVLFVPGYVAATALFPRRHSAASEGGGLLSVDSPGGEVALGGVARTQTISWTERSALSFGLSLALLPLIGLFVAPLGGSLAPEPVFVGLNAFIAVTVVVAVLRRIRVPRDERMRLPYRRWSYVLRRSVFAGRSRADSLLSALLLFAVLTSVVTLGAALVAPQNGEAYTSATLLTEGPDGGVVASGYPTEFTRGEGQQLVVQVENNEGESTSYTVVGQLQRVDAAGDEPTVSDRERLFRERNTVGDGGTWQATHTVTPTMTGEDLRLAYYVYRGDAPADPTAENAYRELYLWIDVSESSS